VHKVLNECRRAKTDDLKHTHTNKLSRVILASRYCQLHARSPGMKASNWLRKSRASASFNLTH